MKLLLIGAGRTGSHAAALIAAKLSKKDELRVIDRDALEESNLQGCALYAKKDLGELKAGLLAKKISGKAKATITSFCEHLSQENVEKLAGGARIVIDCTDNWQTRMLLNEFCWKKGIPWIYAGAIKDRAMCSTIVPRYTPCFACWAAKPEKVQSCSEQGVDRHALKQIAKVQVGEVLALLKGKTPKLAGRLFFYHARKGVGKTIALERNLACSFCVKGKSPYKQDSATVMCGGSEWLFENGELAKNKILSAKEIYSKLEGMERKNFGSVVKVNFRGSEATVFPTGRVMVRGGKKAAACAANHAILQKIS